MQLAFNILLVLALLWLGTNIWITIKARKILPEGRERTLFLMQAWGFPIIGAILSYFELRNLTREPLWKTPGKLPAGFLQADLQNWNDTAQINVPGASAFFLRAHLQTINGLPVLNWTQFQQWLDTIGDPAHRLQAMLTGQRVWLVLLRQAIGPHCYLYESDCAWVLSTMEPNVLMASARFIAKTKGLIQSTMGEMAHFPPGSKSILLVFDDDEIYARYHRIYNPKNDPLHLSSGMFFDPPGCSHFIVKRDDLLQVEPVITHELVHNALQWLDIPLWLNEGLAVSVERRLHRATGDFLPMAHLHAKLQTFWHPGSIQYFWSGESFHCPDNGLVEMSYELAHILVENMAHGQEAAFSRFVRAAKRADAGALAARRELMLDLGDAVCTLLDYPPAPQWAPRA